MLAAKAFAARAAQVDAPVLLTGETGTGKTLVARWIHAHGSRAAGPFVAVNCAAIPDALFESELFGHRRGSFTGADADHDGLFVQASGGTLLLDEVAELDRARQAKLLTVLEDREVRPVGGRSLRAVDVRVVAATSRDIPAAVADGSFRRDLYHRIALLAWTLPSLRERGDDAVLLARRLLDRFGRRHGVPEPRLSREAAAFVLLHPWPGNVRELAHALEAALILEGSPVQRSALEAIVRRGAPSAPDPSDGERYGFAGTPDDERASIRDALVRFGGNRTRAARALGMSRNTLRDRMRRYGLMAPSRNPARPGAPEAPAP